MSDPVCADFNPKLLVAQELCQVVAKPGNQEADEWKFKFERQVFEATLKCNNSYRDYGSEENQQVEHYQLVEDNFLQIAKSFRKYSYLIFFWCHFCRLIIILYLVNTII